VDDVDMARLWGDYRAALAARRLRLEGLGPSVLERHRPMLECLDAVEGSSVAVYDLAAGAYAFLTGSFHFLAGLSPAEARAEGPDYFYRLMHPEDLAFVLDTVTRSLRFLDGLPAGRRKDYKLAFEYRMKAAGGGWIRLVQQVLVLEEDGRGETWLVLIVNDRAIGGDPGQPPAREMRNLRDGSLALFAGGAEEGAPGGLRLSPRELEVLGLVAEGLASKEIAQRLSISVATVNNHRRSILGKTGARSSAEAVAWATRRGLTRP
jgi:DNA-binding CsgD family transcriptional regulator